MHKTPQLVRIKQVEMISHPENQKLILPLQSPNLIQPVMTAKPVPNIYPQKSLQTFLCLPRSNQSPAPKKTIQNSAPKPQPTNPRARVKLGDNRIIDI